MVSLTEPQVITIAEYNKLRENSESRLEYIDGIVYMTPPPSTKHQRISSRLHAKLFNFLEGKEGDHQVEVLKETGIAHSEILKGFSINLEELFK